MKHCTRFGALLNESKSRQHLIDAERLVIQTASKVVAAESVDENAKLNRDAYNKILAKLQDVRNALKDLQ